MEKKQFKGGMFITPRDIQIITGTMSDRVARREHLSIRDALGKRSGRITIKEYCDYWEIDLNETLEFLLKYR